MRKLRRKFALTEKAVACSGVLAVVKALLGAAEDSVHGSDPATATTLVTSEFEEPVGRDGVEDETSVRSGGDTAAGLQREYVSDFTVRVAVTFTYVGVQVCADSASTARVAVTSDPESGING